MRADWCDGEPSDHAQQGVRHEQALQASRGDLDAALREASAAGALAATRRGAQPSLPTRAELNEFLKHASH